MLDGLEKLKSLYTAELFTHPRVINNLIAKEVYHIKNDYFAAQETQHQDSKTNAAEWNLAVIEKHVQWESPYYK